MGLVSADLELINGKDSPFVSPFVGVIHQQTKEMSSSEVFSKKQMNKENLFNFLKK